MSVVGGGLLPKGIDRLPASCNSYHAYVVIHYHNGASRVVSEDPTHKLRQLLKRIKGLLRKLCTQALEITWFACY